MEELNQEMYNLNQGQQYQEEPKMGLFKRIISVFVSPGELFNYINKKPDILVPLLTMTILSVLSTLINFGNMKVTMMEVTRSMGKAQGLEYTAQQLEQISNFQTIGAVVGAPIGVILAWFITSLIVYLVFRLFKGNKGLVKYLSVVGYSYIIALLTTLVLSVYGVFTGQYTQVPITSVVTLVDTSNLSSFVIGVLTSIELFSIWYYCVAAIGLTKVTGLGKSKVYTIVSVLFILSLVISGVTVQLASSSLAGFGM